MNLKSLMRRNRFTAKNKPKQDKAKWQLPGFLKDWRANLRRVALLLAMGGALSALAWSLDRPVRAVYGTATSASLHPAAEASNTISRGQPQRRSRMPSARSGWQRAALMGPRSRKG